MVLIQVYNTGNMLITEFSNQIRITQIWIISSARVDCVFKWGRITPSIPPIGDHIIWTITEVIWKYLLCGFDNWYAWNKFATCFWNYVVQDQWTSHVFNEHCDILKKRANDKFQSSVVVVFCEHGRYNI